MPFFAVCLIAYLLICVAQSAPVTPTTFNVKGEYYESSDSGWGTTFRGKHIKCSGGSSACYVMCKGNIKCQQTTIDASKADILYLDCSSEQACDRLQIVGAPKSLASLACTGKKSCTGAYLNVSTTPKVLLSCDYQRPSYDSAACFETQLFAEYATSVLVQCGVLMCERAAFHVTYSENALIQSSDTGLINSKIVGSGMSGTLGLQCPVQNACGGVQVICPKDGGCDIECDGDVKYISGQFCKNMNIVVPDTDYSQLSLACDSEYACQGFAFTCVNGSSSALRYGDNGFECAAKDGDQTCCPISQNPIQILKSANTTPAKKDHTAVFVVVLVCIGVALVAAAVAYMQRKKKAQANDLNYALHSTQ